MSKVKSLVAAMLVTVCLGGCATPPPAEPENVCAIFKENRSWYKAAKNTREKWGAPEHITMAIMYQESSFKHNAAPPMQYFLGFIPIGRASSAYGYAQAKTITWDDYVKETGNSWSSRSNFSDAMDFMGWYIYKTNAVNKVSKWDAYAQYLNYHEGWGGYRRGTYNSKAWLVNVSKRVDRRANQYAQQLQGCRKDLDRGWLYRLFFG
ncbi:hypothetical protein [Paraferrimonas haliotis]|uniref:Transglycosylase SLT domain-containing protein n=1 Tax=Paraferrimonas haliotis TaxID=2013866 RepID=A0AA37TK93_9GAMM|nr:hypothetical protein [Paraferrimonas haliotis]GLS82784.1 hypothetical protein GCM10007894_07610 [Paraferrimonas haliotis]